MGRILGILLEDYPECVYLSGWVGHGSYNDEFLGAINFEFNEKGEYILNEDNGNTEYLLSLIGKWSGVIFKGMDRLKEFNELQYCASFGVIDYEFTYNSGITLFSSCYDAESG